jgi:hypothetical protein
MEGGGRPPKRRKVETGMTNLQIESCLKGYPATVCCTDELPAHVGVRPRTFDDQDVGETAVIRFRCVSQRIEKFGGSHEGKVKRHPVTSALIGAGLQMIGSLNSYF